MQQNDPVICHMVEWMPQGNHTMLSSYLRGHITDTDCKIYTSWQKDFVTQQGLLYMKTTPPHTNKEVLASVIPNIKR